MKTKQLFLSLLTLVALLLVSCGETEKKESVKDSSTTEKPEAKGQSSVVDEDSAANALQVAKSLDDFYSDTPEFLDYAIRSIHECETTPCIFNILDDSDRSIGRYSAGFGYLGSQAFFNLDKENAASIGTKYGANFANLASNDIDLIKVASTHYIPRISQIYYWFGLAYGDMCQVHIQNLSQIQLTTTRTRTDGYGNSQVTNEGEDYYPIEEEFAARAVEYGNKWVSGLLQVELQKMTYNFIENWGCSSTPVVNMRQNLLNFGLDQFDAGNVENM